MKFIGEICVDPEVGRKEYKIRKTVRAIVLNDKNQVAILHDTKAGFHHLPGGGIDEGEEIMQSLHRECLEEVGSKVKVVGDLGVTIEYRNTQGMIQISYCYVVKTFGAFKQPELSEGEISAGQVTEWHTLENAIKIFESEIPNEFTKKWEAIGPRFDWLEFLAYKSCTLRELAFLREYKRSIKP
ncbi:MAG: NUDIX domain-containing protein [Firmicutes bacterium]|nr:NUDIX domain-containing protein [Bacillota bacterium]